MVVPVRNLVNLSNMSQLSRRAGAPNPKFNKCIHLIGPCWCCSVAMVISRIESRRLVASGISAIRRNCQTTFPSTSTTRKTCARRPPFTSAGAKYAGADGRERFINSIRSRINTKYRADTRRFPSGPFGKETTSRRTPEVSWKKSIDLSINVSRVRRISLGAAAHETTRFVSQRGNCYAVRGPLCGGEIVMRRAPNRTPFFDAVRLDVCHKRQTCRNQFKGYAVPSIDFVLNSASKFKDCSNSENLPCFLHSAFLPLWGEPVMQPHNQPHPPPPVFRARCVRLVTA